MRYQSPDSVGSSVEIAEARTGLKKYALLTVRHPKRTRRYELDRYGRNGGKHRRMDIGTLLENQSR
jgi:hypothetical protein